MAVATNKGERLTLLERDVSEIKGEYRHVATKADVVRIEGELRLVKWMLGIQVAATIAFGAAILNLIYG